MTVVVVGEVRFEWEQVDEVGDCMNRATVRVEDACHTVVGHFQEICSYEQEEGVRWEWKTQIEGSTVSPNGYDDGTFGTDLRSFVKIAMQQTAQYFRGELADFIQLATPAMLT